MKNSKIINKNDFYQIGSIVIAIIILAKQLNINPDNIATPIAASLGDVVTLALLSGIGTFYYIFSRFCYKRFFLLIFENDIHTVLEACDKLDETVTRCNG